jgi:hypothetical protein
MNCTDHQIPDVIADLVKHSVLWPEKRDLLQLRPFPPHFSVRHGQ